MHYFFGEEKKDNLIYIRDKDVINHFKVLRISENEDFIVSFDENIYLCNTKEIRKNVLCFKIIKTMRKRVKPFDMRLYQVFPKKKKFEFIIEKAIETGFTEINPVKSQFMQSKYIPEKEDRYQKIALNTAMQCKSDFIPEIKSIQNIEDLKLETDIGIVLYVNSENDLKDFLKRKGNISSVSVVIGPEGGFTQEEVKLLNDKGFVDTRINTNTLRTETACIYIGSVLNYEFKS